MTDLAQMCGLCYCDVCKRILPVMCMYNERLCVSCECEQHE
jgi:hypothetical protein